MAELTVHLIICKVLRKFPQPMQAVSRERSKVTPGEVAQSAIRQAVT